MKKLLALLLSLVLCVSLAIPAFAADGTSNSNIIPDNEVQNYALNFMTTSQNNENITIDDSSICMIQPINLPATMSPLPITELLPDMFY